ncbi:MAG: M20/M25/M40 family metallo-hydrolase [Steroidobacteraceae bacterium]
MRMLLRCMPAVLVAWLCAQNPMAVAAAINTTDTWPHIAIDATLAPASHEITVQATVTLPAAMAGQRVEFLLAEPLKIDSSRPRATALAAATTGGFSGINGSSAALTQSGHARRYRLQLPKGVNQFTLRYRGVINYPLTTPEQEYARGFSETAGQIGEQGVYLAGSTLWYPYLGEQLFTFDLKTAVPDGWQLISPGNGTSRDAEGRAHWSAELPIDELHLVGGPLTRYSRAAGNVEALVYLTKPDNALANKYLEATAQYLEMYRQLIGPYPYGKFALVENYWETGYGMPSFTLLGPQIIRFPFILTSSYPHEILHNWWGNSVFVDYGSGNWCEGLTAYLADHLIKEQQGQGAEYRRDTLKRYRDFVGSARDFPLTEFRSRHSPATEAVGYGKALMLFHMLRRQQGDDAYRRGLARFYREKKGQRASFDDLRAAHEADAAFFEQWVTRTGAPQLSLEVAPTRRNADGTHRVYGHVHQLQEAEPYVLDVLIRIHTASGVRDEVLHMDGRDAVFEYATDAAPLLVELDPEFDLFRALDARETAPSVGMIFGESAITAILPADASAAELGAWREMLKFWQGPEHSITVVNDDSLQQLPTDRSVWIIGRSNRFAAPLLAPDPAIGLDSDAGGVSAAGQRIAFEGHSAVIVRRHPADPTHAIGFIHTASPAASAAVARKLPHYGKYSYLGFAGDAGDNKVKGDWPAVDSPLRVDLRGDTSQAVPALPASARRKALIELPAVFDAAAMKADVEWLADPAREGRGPGSAGLRAAGDFVAARMKSMGLQPGGVDGGYFQPFDVAAREGAKGFSTRNVIGVLPGSNPAFAGQWVLLSAHYDHLGTSGPGVRVNELGRVHPGADDNASGVAVMLELARNLAAGGPLPRTIVFAGFSAEEWKLVGSHYYADHPTPLPMSGLRAVVNLDTVGRLGDQAIKALATGTASEWVHVFRGVGFTTGIKIESIPGAAESSDQMSFIEKGIPGVQLFTSAHLDYHRPTDTADKIDSAGMVKVATVAKETIVYLAERIEPLTVTIDGAASAGAGRTASEGGAAGGGGASSSPRRVSFGFVPDYAFQGRGVRAESIVPGSPADRAGLKSGDVLLQIDTTRIESLRGFADALRPLQPGTRVTARIERGGAPRTVQVELTER